MFSIDIDIKVPESTTVEEREHLKNRMVTECKEILEVNGLLSESDIEGHYTLFRLSDEGTDALFAESQEGADG